MDDGLSSRSRHNATAAVSTSRPVAANPKQRLIFRMLCREVENDRTHNVDFQLMFLCILESHLREFVSDSSASNGRRHKCVKE